MWLDQKVAIAAQSHVDDTYLPTNKQPPPSSAIDQPPLYDSMVCCCFVCWCCAAGFDKMQRHLIGSKSVQKRRKEEHQRPNLLPPFLNNPLISVAGKQSAISR